MNQQISLHTIFKETILYGFSKLIPGIAGLSAIIIFIRFLGSETYGQYSLILAQCNLLVAFCFGWLNQSQLRYLENDKQHDQFPISLITSFIVSSITGAIFLFILFWSGRATFNEINVSLICIGSIACFTVIKTLYQSNINPGQVIWITSVQSILAILLPLGIIFTYDRTSTAILFGVSLSFLFVSSWVIIRNIKLRPPNIFSLLKEFQNLFLVHKWLRFGIPISLWFAFGLALPYLDRLFIAHFLAPTDLGNYAGLQELITRTFSLLLFPLIMALHPRIMNLWDQANYSQVVDLLKIGILSLIGIFALIFLSTQIFNQTVFKLLQWAIPDISLKFKPLVMPLLIAGFFWQLSFLTHKMLELEERTMMMVFFILVSLLINIVGNFVFIPLIGVLATAYTAATSAVVYCFLTTTFSVHSLIKRKYKQ